ncbi:MAG: sulfatase-like hydrolase/transferase [Anaerolineales bacterium]
MPIIRRLSRRDFLRLGAVTAGSVALASCDAQWLRFSADERPNFVIIETDDQRYDTMQYMPQTQEHIFDQGVTFDHGYVTTPLCSPSRNSIFTGMYAHTHGVTDNFTEESPEDITFAEHLKNNGYYTGLVGKYSNTWNGEPRPEYDYWVSFKHGQHRYNNALLNVNGEWIRHDKEYITYTFGNYALEFIEKASRRRTPFCLCFTLNAPHPPAIPAAEDKYIELELPERLPSFNEEDLSDKPGWESESSLLTGEALEELDAFRRTQILTLYAADRVIGQLIQALEDKNLLDNTVVIFLSDNGKFWGEHRLTSKNNPYEEVSRVPFALRYPPLVPVPYTEDRVVANIDIAPTFYDLAGIPIPEQVDGESLVKLFNGTDWREGILIEGWPGRGVYAAYHTGRYVYIETAGAKSEFYDLEKDPYEMTSAIDDPAYQPIIEHMKAKLAELKAKEGDIRPSSNAEDE